MFGCTTRYERDGPDDSQGGLCEEWDAMRADQGTVIIWRSDRRTPVAALVCVTRAVQNRAEPSGGNAHASQKFQAAKGGGEMRATAAVTAAAMTKWWQQLWNPAATLETAGSDGSRMVHKP